MAGRADPSLSILLYQAAFGNGLSQAGRLFLGKLRPSEAKAPERRRMACGRCHNAPPPQLRPCGRQALCAGDAKAAAQTEEATRRRKSRNKAYVPGRGGDENSRRRGSYSRPAAYAPDCGGEGVKKPL